MRFYMISMLVLLYEKCCSIIRYRYNPNSPMPMHQLHHTKEHTVSNLDGLDTEHDLSQNLNHIAQGQGQIFFQQNLYIHINPTLKSHPFLMKPTIYFAYHGKFSFLSKQNSDKEEEDERTAMIRHHVNITLARSNCFELSFDLSLPLTDRRFIPFFLLLLQLLPVRTHHHHLRLHPSRGRHAAGRLSSSSQRPAVNRRKGSKHRLLALQHPLRRSGIGGPESVRFAFQTPPRRRLRCRRVSSRS